MLRSHLIDRTIQKPSRRLGVSRSILRWGHPALRRAGCKCSPRGHGKREEGMEEERGQGRDRGKRERAWAQMQRHKLLLVVNFICEVVDQNVI